MLRFKLKSQKIDSNINLKLSYENPAACQRSISLLKTLSKKVLLFWMNCISSFPGAILEMFSNDGYDSTFYQERSLSNGSYSSGNYSSGCLTSNSSGPSPLHTTGQPSNGTVSYPPRNAYFFEDIPIYK